MSRRASEKGTTEMTIQTLRTAATVFDKASAFGFVALGVALAAATAALLA